MSKIAVVYQSGAGNTEAVADKKNHQLEKTN